MVSRSTYHYILILLVVVSAMFGPVGRAGAELDSNEDTFEKLARATEARELFKAGETAYKSGKLETAAAYWLKTLEVKPDSTYTKECLTKTQKMLLAGYGKYAAKQLANEDRISAYLALKSLYSYIPNDATLSTKADAIKAKMTANEVKAAKAYDDAAYYYKVKNYVKAKEAIQEARGLASGSESLKMASATIQKAYDANPPKPPKKEEEPKPDQQQIAAMQQPVPQAPQHAGRIHLPSSSSQSQNFGPLFSANRGSSWTIQQRSTPSMSRPRPQMASRAPQMSRSTSCPPARSAPRRSSG